MKFVFRGLREGDKVKIKKTGKIGTIDVINPVYNPEKPYQVNIDGNMLNRCYSGEELEGTKQKEKKMKMKPTRIVYEHTANNGEYSAIIPFERKEKKFCLNRVTVQGLSNDWDLSDWKYLGELSNYIIKLQKKVKKL